MTKPVSKPVTKDVSVALTFDFDAMSLWIGTFGMNSPSALSRGEFNVHFQPQIDARNNQIIGAEALVRWNHPELGAQSPTEFIKVLEDSGLILEVGTWILDEACDAFKQLIGLKLVDPLNFSLCVNISPRQFRQNDFVERIEHSMISHGLPCSLLKLEITEGIVIQNLEDTISKMRRLKKIGVSFAMDDCCTVWVRAPRPTQPINGRSSSDCPPSVSCPTRPSSASSNAILPKPGA